MSDFGNTAHYLLFVEGLHCIRLDGIQRVDSRMLFHVSQSVIEVALSSKEPQITFSLFKYNKGKDRFKKRYELAYSTKGDGFV